jgi:hypothetical protein
MYNLKPVGQSFLPSAASMVCLDANSVQEQPFLVGVMIGSTDVSSLVMIFGYGIAYNIVKLGYFNYGIISLWMGLLTIGYIDL